MSSIEQKIQNAANKNRELLSVLAETDHAPPALEQQRKYIDDINGNLSQLSSRIKQLTASREKEHKEHEKYRDSVLKRFAFRVGRKGEKFDARAEKEEREYFDALHEEHQAKENEKSLQANLAEAQSQASQLESVAARHKKAQADLDALYDSIFEGPTPGFEEEDAKESAAQQALQNYHDQRVGVESEQQALHLLAQAGHKMAGALSAIESARSNSRMDMFGGGMMADMMERNALSQAESQSQGVQMLVSQAQRMSPYVKNIRKANVAQGNMMSDMLFDNAFTDHAFHQKIKASQDEMNVSAKALEQEYMNCKQRLGDMNGRLGEAGKNLENARNELQRARERAFEKVSGGGGY